MARNRWAGAGPFGGRETVHTVRARFRVTVLAATLTATLAAGLTGCGGPTQAGAAAIVGDQSVPLSEVQHQVDEAMARPEVRNGLAAAGYGAADVARFLVTRQVDHLLLAEAAKRDGIGVTDQAVDAELAKPEVRDQLAGELVTDPAESRQAVRDELIAEALAGKYLDHLAVTADVVPAASRDEALRLAQRLAAGPAQAAAVLAAAGQNAQHVEWRAIQVPAAATGFLFGIPAGQVAVTPAPRTPDIWLAVRVTQRVTDAAADGDVNAGAKTGAASQLGAQTLELIGRRLTQPLAQELGVRVNPRYGSWDPVQLGVLPPDQQPGVLLPARLS